MFDNIKFALADIDGNRLPLQLTALALLRILYDKHMIDFDNAYSVCNWIAHAEPHEQYNSGTFRIYALPY